MNLDWINLDEDENVLWQGQPRMKSILPALIIGAFMTPLFGIGLLIIISSYFHIKNTSFVVTDEGLYRKQGTFSRSVQKISFDKIQNISFSQGMFGNYFDYGNIDISTAGGSGVEMKFESINNPREVEEKINSHLKKHQGNIDKDESGGSELEELREIKDILKDINSKLQ
ncbi:MAG: PH domain-containing protein [Candidatus Nanohalobium sp.]